MKLRNYQQAAVDAVIESWKKSRSCLIVLPTGCGKTVVFGEVIRRRLAIQPPTTNHEPPTPNHEPRTTNHESRAMVLAHREELISQAEEKVAAITALPVGVEMGPRQTDELPGMACPVVISSVQTQITGRMRKFSPDDFTTLVIDEAHHATSKSYRLCIEHYLENPCCRLLGVTATPDRADETALGIVFDTVAYEYSVDQAIRDGWLVPVRQKLVSVSSLDFSQVSTCAGDFNQGELSEILEEEQNLHGIASPTIEICGERRAIVFATSVRQADRLAEIINRTREGRAEWICGKTQKEKRKAILKDFKEGKLQYIVNVGVLTEGFDDAGVEVVVMARPTKSRALYAQMAGRATRPAAEIAAKLGDSEDRLARCEMIRNSSKPSCLIVDFVGNSGRHKLVTALDILGGKQLDPDEEEAQAIVKKRCEESENGLDTLEELEKVRDEIRRRKEEEVKRRAFIKLTAKYSVVSIDPFNVYDLAPMNPEQRSSLDQHRLSFKQRQVIRERIGVDPNTLHASEGKALLDAYFGRRERGLATLRQTRYLRRKGVLMPMTFEEASATISRLTEGRRVAR